MFKALCKNKFQCWDGIPSHGGHSLLKSVTFGKVNVAVCLLNGDHGEGNGTPLQYFCLENPMDGGAWKSAVHGVAEGWT